MKRYWLKEEALIDIKEENSISGRDICRLTIHENVTCYVSYCKVSAIVNRGDLAIAYSEIDTILGKGKIFAYHSDLRSVVASKASINSSYARGVSPNCNIEGNFSEFYDTTINNQKSVFEDCIFGSCEINAGRYTNCIFEKSCKISKNAVIR